MKKILLVFFFVIGTAFRGFADEGHGGCVISGTNEYVEVTAYSDGKQKGNFVIANSASKPLLTLFITITAEVSNNNSSYETKTIYEKNYNGRIEPNQSAFVDFTYNWNYIRNIQVRVSNPVCK